MNKSLEGALKDFFGKYICWSTTKSIHHIGDFFITVPYLTETVDLCSWFQSTAHGKGGLMTRTVQILVAGVCGRASCDSRIRKQRGQDSKYSWALKTLQSNYWCPTFTSKALPRAPTDSSNIACRQGTSIQT